MWHRLEACHVLSATRSIMIRVVALPWLERQRAYHLVEIRAGNCANRLRDGLEKQNLRHHAVRIHAAKSGWSHMTYRQWLAIPRCLIITSAYVVSCTFCTYSTQLPQKAFGVKQDSARDINYTLCEACDFVLSLSKQLTSVLGTPSSRSRCKLRYNCYPEAAFRFHLARGESA